MKKKGREISVKKAAQALNLSERTVLNFIKQKKLEAIKVGRDWYIDYASFVSFALKYNIPISERSESLSEKVIPVSERLESANKIENNLKPSLKRANHIPSLGNKVRMELAYQ